MGDAFVVLGKRIRACEPSPAAVQTFDFFDDGLSNMQLRGCPYSKAGLQILFEGSTVLDIADLPDDPVSSCSRFDKSKAALLPGHGDLIICGCLVQKHDRRRGKDGRKYAVWTMCNMQTGLAEKFNQGRPKATTFTSINLLLYDDAYEMFHMKVPGDVFAFRNPSVLPPRPKSASALPNSSVASSKNATRKSTDEWSGLCLKITRPQDVYCLGICVDFAICGRPTNLSPPCSRWYHKKLSTACATHTRRNAERVTQSTRMDINNQERPGLGRRDFTGSVEATNMSIDSGAHTVGPAASAPPILRSDLLDGAELTRRRDVLSKAKMLRSLAAVNPGAVLKAQRRAPLARPPRPAGDKGSSVRPGSFNRSEWQSLSNPGHRGVASTGGSVTSSSSHNEKYQRAVATLLHLGFKTTKEGGLLPPDRRTIAKLGLALRKKQTCFQDEEKAAQVLEKNRTSDEGNAPAVLPATKSHVGPAPTPRTCSPPPRPEVQGKNAEPGTTVVMKSDIVAPPDLVTFGDGNSSVHGTIDLNDDSDASDGDIPGKMAVAVRAFANDVMGESGAVRLSTADHCGGIDSEIAQKVDRNSLAMCNTGTSAGQLQPPDNPKCLPVVQDSENVSVPLMGVVQRQRKECPGTFNNMNADEGAGATPASVATGERDIRIPAGSEKAGLVATQNNPDTALPSYVVPSSMDDNHANPVAGTHQLSEPPSDGMLDLSDDSDSSN